ncbi:MAG: Ig-like domain-containing protein [Kofleriaceae bacterium]
MIRQVRMQERYQDATNPSILRTRRVFGFGTHDLASEDEAHPVNTAVAVNNQFRIIIDELLVGNSLEEIACRIDVDEDKYQRVPLGATPDDIARCANADDVIPQTCKGSDPRSVCICAKPAGCSRGGTIIPQGDPVGVLDVNRDGAADDSRMIAGAIGFSCNGIAVAANLDLSYWNPSGDQNRPSTGGFDALGPAIVLAAQGPLPTSTRCKLTAAADVVDKQGNQLCAPPNGDIHAGCTAGSLDAFEFGVEAMTVTPNSFQNGQTGVNRTAPLTFASNVPVDAASLAQITFSPSVTFTATAPMPTTIRVEVPAGLAANTEYTVTFPTTVRDSLMQGLPQPQTFRFTTGN